MSPTPTAPITSGAAIDYTRGIGGPGISVRTAADVTKLTGADAGFRSFITAQLAAATARFGDQCPVVITVDRYLADRLAEGGVLACGGYAALWVNKAGAWREAIGTQEAVRCAALRRAVGGATIPQGWNFGSCWDGTKVIRYQP